MHPASPTRPAPLVLRLAVGLAVFLLLLLAGLAAANAARPHAPAAPERSAAPR
jgi:hypothetical protein